MHLETTAANAGFRPYSRQRNTSAPTRMLRVITNPFPPRLDGAQAAVSGAAVPDAHQDLD